jgi:hypothetical protein
MCELVWALLGKVLKKKLGSDKTPPLGLRRCGVVFGTKLLLVVVFLQKPHLSPGKRGGATLSAERF